MLPNIFFKFVRRKFHETGKRIFPAIRLQHFPDEMDMVGHNHKTVDFYAVFFMQIGKRVYDNGFEVILTDYRYPFSNGRSVKI